jgi:Holliday junction resolvasome RuvABC endonuclease subunit
MTAGWALQNLKTGEVRSGVWIFKDKRGDGAGVRFLRLQARLDEILSSYPLRRVVYERPSGQFKNGAAEDSIKGMASHVLSWCEKNSVPCEGFAQTEIKKFATGKGNAKKDQMLAEAVKRWGDVVTDHNQADALWTLALGQESL